MITAADKAACVAYVRDCPPATLATPPAVASKRLFVSDPARDAMAKAVNWLDLGSPDLARLTLLKALHAREL